VQRSHLTDDELWRAIANNTNAMSTVFQEQTELDTGRRAPDPKSRAILKLFNVQLIDKYHREYRGLTAEIRRRYQV
jgi:hypothetical protein